ncbi:porphobilinogen deaminase [Rhizina undulata]
MSSYLLYQIYVRLMSALNGSPTAVVPQKRKVRIGTRKSKLALVQTEIVHGLLKEKYPEFEFEIVAMTTTGDNNLLKSLHSFGAKALWTQELEELLLDDSLDMIVHSLKDMPTQLPAGCKIGAILEREDPRDALVMKAGSTYTSLDDLPEGSVIGTSSVRRSAQIAKRYPHLKFRDVRGNVGTRLSKLDDTESAYACLILAAAGLHRLDLNSRITSYLSSPTVLHAVGQGALGVEIRENDPATEELLKSLVHEPTYLSCFAERSLMRTLEGGCSVPIGVETEFTEDGKLKMRAIVASVDGTQSVEAEEEMVVVKEEDADEFGRVVAGKLVERGAGDILNEISLTRDAITA